MLVTLPAAMVMLPVFMTFRLTAAEARMRRGGDCGDAGELERAGGDYGGAGVVVGGGKGQRAGAGLGQALAVAPL